MSKYQIRSGIEDALASFKKDTMEYAAIERCAPFSVLLIGAITKSLWTGPSRSGHGLCKEPLVDVLVQNSADALEFISDFGLELSNLIQLGGHSAKR
jgi:hypothetical protein